MSEKIELTASDKLKPGDIVEIDFEYQGFFWWTAASIAIFEERLKRNPQYELLRYNYQDNDIVAQLRVTNKISDPERGITFNEMTLWLVALPGLASIVLKKAYKIVETVAIGIVDTATTIWNWKYIILAGAGVLLYMYFFDCGECKS